MSSVAPCDIVHIGKMGLRGQVQAMIEQSTEPADRGAGPRLQERPAPHPPRRGDCKPPRAVRVVGHHYSTYRHKRTMHAECFIVHGAKNQRSNNLSE